MRARTNANAANIARSIAAKRRRSSDAWTRSLIVLMSYTRLVWVGCLHLLAKGLGKRPGIRCRARDQRHSAGAVREIDCALGFLSEVIAPHRADHADNRRPGTFVAPTQAFAVRVLIAPEAFGQGLVNGDHRTFPNL